jgi:hypothetical protein
MTAPNIPTFEEFARTLVGDDGPLPDDSIPLSKLAAGDYAVLAWLDDVEWRVPPGVEAEITARWDKASLREVYAMIVAGIDESGVQAL